MADSDILKWMTKNHEKIGLKLTEFFWTTEWLPNFSDIEVRVQIDEKSFVGRSVSSSKDQATIKAFTESVERAATFAAGKESSSGIAAHDDFALAKKNAYYEAIQHDRLIRHCLDGVPMARIPVLDIPKECTVFHELHRKLLTFAVELGCVQMHTSGDAKVVQVYLSNSDPLNQLGIITGFGVGADFYQAIEKACLEVSKNIPSYLERKIRPLTNSEFAKLLFREPNDHMRLGIDPEYSSEYVNAMLSNSEIGLKLDREIGPNEVEFKALNLPREFAGLPIFVVQCESDRLLKLNYFQNLGSVAKGNFVPIFS